MESPRKKRLKDRFKNGTRPTEEDFASLIDDCYGYVDKAEMNGDNLVLSGLIGNRADELTVTVNLGKYDQRIQYDGSKNALTLSNQAQALHLGYWSPKGEPNHKAAVDWIQTNSKVGIGNPAGSEPKANLEVKGSLALENGPLVNEISTNLYPKAPGNALPTVKLVRDSIASLPKLMLHGSYDVSGVREFRSDSRMIAFHKLMHLDSAAKFDGVNFTAPTAGVYQIDLKLMVRQYNTGTGKCFFELMETYFEGIKGQGQKFVKSHGHFWHKTAGISGNDEFISGSILCKLSKSDQLYVKLGVEGNAALTLETSTEFQNTLTITRLLIENNPVEIGKSR